VGSTASGRITVGSGFLDAAVRGGEFASEFSSTWWTCRLPRLSEAYDRRRRLETGQRDDAETGRRRRCYSGPL